MQRAARSRRVGLCSDRASALRRGRGSWRSASARYGGRTALALSLDHAECIGGMRAAGSLAQELGDSAGGCQVRRSGLIEALGTLVMGQGRRPTLKSAAHDAACVPGVVRQPEQPPRCWAASPKRKVGGAVGSATGALLALTAPRRVARLGYVP